MRRTAGFKRSAASARASSTASIRWSPFILKDKIDKTGVEGEVMFISVFKLGSSNPAGHFLNLT